MDHLLISGLGFSSFFANFLPNFWWFFKLLKLTDIRGWVIHKAIMDPYSIMNAGEFGLSLLICKSYLSNFVPKKHVTTSLGEMWFSHIDLGRANQNNRPNNISWGFLFINFSNFCFFNRNLFRKYWIKENDRVSQF